MDTILLIDDTESLSPLLVDRLRSEGHEVLVADDPVAAYETFIRKDIGVVLVNHDERSRGPGALTYVRTFRERNNRHDLPIVVFTRDADDPVGKPCEHAGANLVLGIDGGYAPGAGVFSRLAGLLRSHEHEFTGHSMDNDMGRAIIRATVSVFSTMVGMDVVEGEIQLEKVRARRAEVIGSLGVAGCLSGSISLFLGRELALHAAANMLMTGDISDLTDVEIIDAIGEITNMIGGSIKTELFRKVPLFDVSVPSVYLGKDLQRCTVSDDLCFFVPFHADDRQFAVEFLLVRSESSTTTGVQGAVLQSMPD